MQRTFNKALRKPYFRNGSLGVNINNELWTPAKITTTLWLDASDSSTITESSGNISAWADKSGNSRTASQATSALRPAYQSNIQNGLSAVYENGERWLAHSTAYTVRTLIVALKWEDTTGDWRTIVSNALTSAADGIWSGNTAPGNPMFGSFSSTEIRSGTGHINGSSLSPGSWVRYTNPTIHVMNTQTNPQNVLIWGGDRMETFTTRGFKGWYFEIITSSSVLSTDDRQRVEGYLAWKWGMVASLPNDHPYKNAAPLG